MIEPRLYEKWDGPTWLNKNDRCQSDMLCARPAEHEGLHADISLSGMVLRTWSEPGLSDAEREVIETVNSIRDDLINAAESAEMQLRHIQSDPAVKSNPGLARLVRDAISDAESDPYNMGLSDDESAWGSRIDELKKAVARGRRAA